MLSTFSRAQSNQASFSASLGASVAPCSPLCSALVARKKSSRPVITFQSTSSPRSRSSGTEERNSSETPPPYGVALMCRMRLPSQLVQDSLGHDGPVGVERPSADSYALEHRP